MIYGNCYLAKDRSKGKNLMDVDKATAAIKEMALQLKELNKIAYHQYEPIVSDLCSRNASSDEVEYVLNRLLDFCGDDAVLGLYRNVCRHYFSVYPEMIACQVNIYRETWDME